MVEPACMTDGAVQPRVGWEGEGQTGDAGGVGVPLGAGQRLITISLDAPDTPRALTLRTRTK